VGVQGKTVSSTGSSAVTDLFVLRCCVTAMGWTTACTSEERQLLHVMIGQISSSSSRSCQGVQEFTTSCSDLHCKCSRYDSSDTGSGNVVL
jgi:hypothetical protein